VLQAGVTRQRRSASQIRWRYLDLLLNWSGVSVLCDNPPIIRYAQSLISRADAELFGVSVPRFALRFYFDKNHKGFVNLRRSNLLRRSVGAWSLADRSISSRPDIALDEPRANSPFPLPYLVGDCILPLPARLDQKGYHTLKNDFGPDYGEHYAIEGTPYVQYCTLTGACAPAVCFIATMLLKNHSKAIHGLPEIAASSPDQPLTHLVVEPMEMGQITAYFQSAAIDLMAILQRIPVYFRKHLESTEVYRLALRSYLRSKMPVILPVDLYRLHGIGSEHCKTRREGHLSIEPRTYAYQTSTQRKAQAKSPFDHCHWMRSTSFQ